MASGCGCKEVYRFPHITYPYSSCICSFLQQHPYFLFIFKCFSFLFQYFFVIYVIIFSRSINTHTGIPRKPYEGCTCFIREAHTNERFISCDEHQLYAFKRRGVDLEVKGVRYIEMHRWLHTCWADPPPSRSGDLELEGGVNVSL